MAKAHRDDDHGRVKFRLIEVEFEGSNASIEEGLRTIANAIGRTKEVTTYVQLPAVPAQAAAQLPSPTTVEVVDDAGDGVALPESRRNKSSAPRKPKAVKAPTFLDDLDIGAAEVPLKDFCQSKNPTTDLHKYLVVMAWLKDQLGITNVTIDHIYTCFDWMSWKVPGDPGQPLRDMKAKKNWISKGEGPGEYCLNHRGKNELLEMGE